MRKHKRDDNPLHEKPQASAKQILMSGQKRKKETKTKQTVESPPRKLRVLENSESKNKEKQDDNLAIDELSLEDRITIIQRNF